MSDLLAAPRDASVWDRPNTRSRKKLHVAINVTNLGRTPGWSHTDEFGEAACDPMRMPLDMSLSMPAKDIPAERRCRRPGCAARWPQEKGTPPA